jgi:hypothetical protein
MRILITLPIVLAVAAGVAAQTSRPVAESAPSSRPAAKDFRFVVPGSTWELKMVAVPPSSFGGNELWCASTEIPWDAYDPFVYLLDVGEGERPRRRDAAEQALRAPGSGAGSCRIPVISVSHRGASAFAAWLSLRTGGTFRLPTESEFETLARAGSGRFALRADGVDRRLRVDGIELDRCAATGRDDETAERVGPLRSSRQRAGVVRHARQEGRDEGRRLQRPTRRTPPSTSVRPYERSWQSTNPNIPKSTWWLSDAPTVGFRVVCTSMPTKVNILRDAGSTR